MTSLAGERGAKGEKKVPRTQSLRGVKKDQRFHTIRTKGRVLVGGDREGKQ